MPNEQKTLRGSVVDPATDKRVWKIVSLSNRTREEAEAIIQKWKDKIRGVHNDESSSDEETPAPKAKATKEPKPEPTLNIKHEEFHLKLPDPAFGVSILAIGSTRSGKTTLINHIYDTYFKPFITCLHTNSLQSPIYDDLKKSAITSPYYLPGLIKQTFKINRETKNKYQFFHIVDDVVDKKNDKTLLKLFTIMRNARISAAVGIQDLTIMSSINRGNINYVILMRLNSELAIEKVIRSYLRSYFPPRTSMVECVRLYKEMTEDRQFFVVDNINGRVYHSKLSL